MASAQRRSRYPLIGAVGVALVLASVGGPYASAQLPQLKTVNEGADATVTVRFKNAFGTVVKPTQVRYRVDDQATGAALLTAQTIVPSSTTLTFVLPGSYQTVVRPGFCSVSGATVCRLTSDCPAGQECRPVQSETHVLTLEFTIGTSGIGTWQQPFSVVNLPFYPLS
jgi:hypothetical protein